jgi:hypothetical protein
VFGGYDGGWFKMASVANNGTFLENRYTNAISSINNLTVAIWNAANIGGANSVTSAVTNLSTITSYVVSGNFVDDSGATLETT